jgi:hypothetical protein
VLLPVRSVGVMGDGRSYDQVLALRAVTSADGMTADVYPFDMAFLGRVATRIINEVKGINRVTYDVTSKIRGAAYRDPKRFFASSVAGMYSETAVPSGSRNWNVLLPQGIIFSSCTSFTLCFRRS